MTFHPVAALADLAENQPLAAIVEGRPIVLCRTEQAVHALDNLCTHSGARLAAGRVVKGVIACPLHGARFDLETGICRNAHMGLRPVVVHQVRVVDGQVEVALSPEPVAQPLT